jgi:hypothetical protein
MTKDGEKENPFLKKLKAICKNCTKESILVYFRNVKRLYKLIDDDGEIPATGAWLSKKILFEKYEKLPLKTKRHLSVAAVKAVKALGQKSDKWEKNMYQDALKYQSLRNKNQKSENEKALWPKKGYKSVKLAAAEQWKRIKHTIKNEPTLSGLYKYQLFIILKLFAEIPFRNTFATLELEKKENNNYISIPQKGKIKLIIRRYKNSKQLGEREVTLSRAAAMALRKFLKYREQVVDHDHFLSSKNGGKLSRAALGKALHRVTKELSGKSYGSRLIRVLAATDKKSEIEAVLELSNKLLHTTKQTKQYTRK